MAAVWKGSQHSGSALLMMLAIADFADDKGQAFPAVSTLAEKTRMRPRNANYLLADLQVSGELDIRIGAGRNGTNLYRIRLDRLQGLHSGAGLQPSAGVQAVAGVQPGAGLHHSARGAAPQCSTPLHPSADKPSLNHHEPSGTSLSRPPVPKFAACPHDKIVQSYHDVLPDLPRVKLMDSKGRKAKIADFWKWVLASTKSDGSKRATNADEALAWIRSYFERARSNDFLMGRTARGEAHSTWRCDFDFLLTEKGKKQVIEKTEVPA
jgi:hypothetical protein